MRSEGVECEYAKAGDDQFALRDSRVILSEIGLSAAEIDQLIAEQATPYLHEL
jgi:hypothetical protein